jgi:putative ABC transport system permease protein
MSRSEIASAARMALATIREHKMRSFLTVLGVIIGTGTVIAVGSIITGMDASISNIFRSFGPTTLIAFKFKIGFRFNVTREEFMRKPLTIDNARAIFDRCPSCKYVSPYLFSGPYTGPSTRATTCTTSTWAGRRRLTPPAAR